MNTHYSYSVVLENIWWLYLANGTWTILNLKTIRYRKEVRMHIQLFSDNFWKAFEYFSISRIFHFKINSVNWIFTTHDVAKQEHPFCKLQSDCSHTFTFRKIQNALTCTKVSAHPTSNVPAFIYPFRFNFPSSKQLLHSFPKVRDFEVEKVVNCAAKLTE